MEEPEQAVYKRIKQEFANEIAALDKGVDVIELCMQTLVVQIPLLHKPNLSANLLNASPEDQCAVCQILLLLHAALFLRATRLLLLSGHIVPSQSCLRSTVESILSAHVCSESHEQSTKWLAGKKVERQQFSYPAELPDSVAKTVMFELSEQGVHVYYSAFVTQACFPGAVFSEENRQQYSFLIKRCIYFSLFISNRFLAYLLAKKPFLTQQIPDVSSILQNLKLKADEIGVELAGQVDKTGIRRYS